jgi:hypothetical protein
MTIQDRIWQKPHHFNTVGPRNMTNIEHTKPKTENEIFNSFSQILIQILCNYIEMTH